MYVPWIGILRVLKKDLKNLDISIHWISLPENNMRNGGMVLCISFHTIQVPFMKRVDDVVVILKS